MRSATLAVFLLLLLASCAEPKKQIPAGRFPDAAAYNDYIVAWLDSLVVSDSLFSSAFAEGRPATAVTKASKLFSERALRIADTLSGLEGWKGDTSLRHAAVAVVRSWAAVPPKYYAQLYPILSTPDAVDTSKITDTLLPGDTLDPNAALGPRYEAIQHRIEKAEGDVFRTFLLAQEAFAAKHHFFLPRRPQPVKVGGG